MSKNPDKNQLAKDLNEDIIELENKISAFKKGTIQEERFRHYRLTRGVYGQRQLGVHMFRTKIPFGLLTADQLIRLADVSEKYTNGNLHLTTRQNIQMHYVKLDDATAIWKELGEVGVTAREACGNTVRNITASANAGIDPDELFDVSPYVYETFRYFLRNPICQDMGRKIKIAFSSSDKDSAYTYFHDFGFVPRIKIENGKEIRGFKLVVGGGLGAQSIIAQTAYEFLPEDQIIPFMEAAIRVFDRYGEREKRFKARMKFLVKELGLEGFLKLVEEEKTAIAQASVKINRDIITAAPPVPAVDRPEIKIENAEAYNLWLTTNVFEQKQKDFYAVQIRLPLGDIMAERARLFAEVARNYAADDIRITVNQGFVLRYVRKNDLPHLYQALNDLDLAKPGFNSMANITACPGTDTCNLGVTNSTGLATVLEEVITAEYPQLIEESALDIKISGCMNACGQHMAANIGFHGSSIKKKPLVVPAMQIVIGGGVDPDGTPQIADKVIKIPTKKIPDALRILLNDYDEISENNEYFNHYYRRQGKAYFYSLLKPLADIEQLTKEEFFDWGDDADYVQAIGVGECAGVAYDVVGTIVKDAEEKVELAAAALAEGLFADSIYHSYTALVIGAKALLLAKDVKCNTQIGILRDFDEHYIDTKEFPLTDSFKELALRVKKSTPNEAFAKEYATIAADFFRQVLEVRSTQLVAAEGKDKNIIDRYYKA